MFRFAVHLVVLLGFVIAAIIAMSSAPDETDAANAGWAEMADGSASGGGISNNSSSSYSASVAVGPNGMPVVAWYDGDFPGNREIYVRRWNGSAWVEMGGSASGGGISNTAGTSSSPAVAVSANNMPIVAWQDNSDGDPEIYVRRWNGSAWVEMGSSASGGGISHNGVESSNPSLAIGSDGAPVVSWTDASPSNVYEVYVRSWNGTAWVELGGSASGGGVSNDTRFSGNSSLAIGSDNLPVVAWTAYGDGPGDIHLRRWNGSTWVEMGGSASGGGISNSSGESQFPSLAVGSDGAPVVAWSDSNGGNLSEIYLRRWNGSSWVGLGGSTSGGGISNTGGYSWRPSLAMDSANRPMVTWHDLSIGNSEVYFRRWSGSAWVEMGSGSATSGGISSNGGDSDSASLTVGPGNTPIIAWSDLSSGDSEIYARRYLPCHILSRSRSGEGSLPEPMPLRSPNCDSDGQYNAQQLITLNAFAATGWRIAGWVGTDNNGSTATTNTLTMPDGTHEVSVIYVLSPTPTFTPTRTPTATSTPTQTPSRTPTSTPTRTVSPTPSRTPSPTPTRTVSPTPSRTPSPTPTRTVSPTPSRTPSRTPTRTVSPTPSRTPSRTPTATPTRTLEATPTATLTRSPTRTNAVFLPSVVHVPLTCWPGPEESDQNDNMTHATGPLCSGRVYSAHDDDTFDYYFLDAAAGEIAIDMTDHTYPKVQLLLYYQRASGPPVQSDTSPEGGWNIRYNGPAGRYYLIVYSDADSFSSTVYTLQASYPTTD